MHTVNLIKHNSKHGYNLVNNTDRDKQLRYKEVINKKASICYHFLTDFTNIVACLQLLTNDIFAPHINPSGDL